MIYMAVPDFLVGFIVGVLLMAGAIAGWGFWLATKAGKKK